MVEKYEQMLAQDPSSTVFVELARAYIDRGENDRAMKTCEQGVTHHPKSVVGRVLWGKALINSGKAAEAMKQFDLAVNIDRNNPHAYNLIAEALLRKGLYRSALPILRRASALQPNDGRISQWLDQTKQALAGGPAPTLPPIDNYPPAPEEVTKPPDDEPDVFAGFEPMKNADSIHEQPTTVMSAYVPEPPRSRPPVPTDELPIVTGALIGERSTQEIPVIQPSVEPPDPFDSSAFGSSEPDTFHGLTSTFDALSDSPTVPPAAEEPLGEEPEPSVVVKASDFTAPQPQPQPQPPPVLEEVLSGQSDVPTSEFPMVGMVQTPAPPRALGGLLDDIPDETVELPPAEVPHTQTEAIAKEYERELRAKFEVAKQKKSFWQAHGSKVALLAGLLVLLGGLGGSFLLTRIKNRGETLDTSLAKGLAAINADTREQYALAIQSLEHALEMDEGNPEALALVGYAHAVLFAEHGGAPEHRQAALDAFAKPNVRTARADLALVVDFLTADESTRAATRQQLLSSTVLKGVVRAQIGRLLLADKKYDEALKELKKATEMDPRNTRALVSLGDYYLAFEDWDNALEMMSLAETLSRFHPARAIGHAEARLELGKELPEALSDLEGLPQSAGIPPALGARYALMLGRAQSANGKHEEALKTLSEAQPRFPEQALEFAMTLGHAHRMAGQMALAQKFFEEALKLAPKSESAKEGLGRVLLARSRERELVDRIRPERDVSKVAVLRGIAWFRLGEMKKARAELITTQVKGKYPAEAAVYLALVDAAEEAQPDKAIEVLEKLATSLKKNKSVVQVALARVYMQKGVLDKARVQLEDAAKDPQDYEGNALLGELLLKAGVPLDVAMEPLSHAVERNGSHAPSRHLLTRTLLDMGRVNDALKQIEAWVQDNPSLELVWRDAAAVYFQAGKLKEAEQALAKISPTADEPEVWRTRALILFARADGRGAMSALERANKLNQSDAETFCEIGNAFVRQGNIDASFKAYEAAVREDAKSICGLAGPSHARPTSKGKPAPAELLKQLINRSNRAWERAFLQATLARVQLAAANVKSAREWADEALATAPAHSAAWFASAEVAKREKDEAKALEGYGKAAELDGSWSQARLAYADALAKQGGDSVPKAITQYEAVLVIDQNESELSRVKKTLAALKKQQ